MMGNKIKSYQKKKTEQGWKKTKRRTDPGQRKNSDRESEKKTGTKGAAERYIIKEKKMGKGTGLGGTAPLPLNHHQSLMRRSRSALATTETELNAMVNAQISGRKCQWNSG